MEVSACLQYSSPTRLIKGILGLCAVILSSPYDIPKHLPNALAVICQHSHDPFLIQVSLFLHRTIPSEQRFPLQLEIDQGMPV